VKQALFAYVNHARICSWYQPVLSNENKVSCSRKQRGPLMGLERVRQTIHCAMPVHIHSDFLQIYINQIHFVIWKLANYKQKLDLPITYFQ